MPPRQGDSPESYFYHLEDALGYQFSNYQLLSEALTHRSFGAPNNERLEFLGDAILDAIAAQLLFLDDGNATEGQLSRQRSALVNGKQLAELASGLGLQTVMKLGRGEKSEVVRPSILEGAFEALAGAVFLDSDYETCKKVFSGLLQSAESFQQADDGMKDAKTRLQEWFQAKAGKLPKYKLTDTSGPDHAKRFFVSAEISEPALTAHGEGSSRKLAEQDAADQLLIQLRALSEI